MGRSTPSSYRLEFIDADTNVRIVKFVTSHEEVEKFSQQGYSFDLFPLYDHPINEASVNAAALEQAARLCEGQADATREASGDLDVKIQDAVQGALMRVAELIRALKHKGEATNH